jgi:hypothetical protein
MNNEPRLLIHQFSNSLILSAFGGVNLGNSYLSNQFNLGNLWLKNQSIKNNKLCKTNPISEMPKMNLNPSLTKYYGDKSGLLTMEKQSQTNPIQTQSNPIKPNFSRLSN